MKQEPCTGSKPLCLKEAILAKFAHSHLPSSSGLVGGYVPKLMRVVIPRSRNKSHNGSGGGFISTEIVYPAHFQMYNKHVAPRKIAADPCSAQVRKNEVVLFSLQVVHCARCPQGLRCYLLPYRCPVLGESM